MKVRIASYEETVEHLKNEPYRIVSPKRSRKYTESLRKRRTEQTSSNKNYRKNNLEGGK